jgi:plastocyanin
VRRGKSATVHLNKAGTFAYHCAFHPFMKGTVVVK